MKITSIEFENYKAFKEPQKLILKPITLLIGKNSSGKSAVAKLFTLLENSLTYKIDEPLLLVNNGVELGGVYADIVYNKNPAGNTLKFKIEFSTGETVKIAIVQEKLNYPLTIYEWSIEGNDKYLSLQYSPENGYTGSNNGKKYTCKFNGFLPIELLDEDGNNLIGKLAISPNVDVDYIGPFRMLPNREYYLSGKIKYDKIGIQGENAYSMLGVSKLMKKELHENVATWFEEHFDGWRLNTEGEDSIRTLLSKNGIDVNIVDVGQGMNQVLPLVVRSFENSKDAIIVSEQPELHLHPAAHGDLVELFAHSAKKHNHNFVIETHSENFLSRLRKLVVEGTIIKSTDVVIYWVNDAKSGGQQLSEIGITEDGVLSDWPEGVFGENISEIIEIRKAIRRKNETK